MEINNGKKSGYTLEEYCSDYFDSPDIRDYQDEEIGIKLLERRLIQKGIFLKIPEYFQAQIPPGSSLAVENGISVFNFAGSIDSDHRGEFSVIMINLSNRDFGENTGDRICRMVLAKQEKNDRIGVEILEKMDRS